MNTITFIDRGFERLSLCWMSWIIAAFRIWTLRDPFIRPSEGNLFVLFLLNLTNVGAISILREIAWFQIIYMNTWQAEVIFDDIF